MKPIHLEIIYAIIFAVCVAAISGGAVLLYGVLNGVFK
jgi:hypothetical protein